MNLFLDQQKLKLIIYNGIWETFIPHIFAQ